MTTSRLYKEQILHGSGIYYKVKLTDIPPPGDHNEGSLKIKTPSKNYGLKNEDDLKSDFRIEDNRKMTDKVRPRQSRLPSLITSNQFKIEDNHKNGNYLR